MKDLEFRFTIFSILITIISIIWATIWTIMCLDYKEQVEQLQQDKIECQWELAQVDQMICNNEE